MRRSSNASIPSCLIVVVLVCSLMIGQAAAREASADNGDCATWRFAAGADSAHPDWTAASFDDASWSRDPGGPVAELAASGGGMLRIRGSFAVVDPDGVDSVTLEIASTSGFVVLMNGREVLRSPRPLPYSIEPDTGHVRGYEFDLSGIGHELLPGKNLLAIEMTISAAPGSGLAAIPRLIITSRDVGLDVESAPITDPPSGQADLRNAGEPRYVILLVCDGWGAKQIEAANRYTGTTPGYQTAPEWTKRWMATYPAGGGYDPAQAWSDISYPLQGPTDSAAAASALYTGSKTGNGRVCANAEGSGRLVSLAERARSYGMTAGVVTTVPVSHATPAAMTSHNLSRGNTFAIADEAFFGHPNTTGDVETDAKYGGGFGPTLPVTDVVIGDRNASYLNSAQRDKLHTESGLAGKHLLVEGQTGIDASALLNEVASVPDTEMLAGLFDRINLRVTASGGGYRPETPSLAETASAALTVLERGGSGAVLVIEGGAVDWAGHANDLDWMIGEFLDFNAAVAAVVEWVEDPGNDSSWDNTLVVVAGDHETGFLTNGPGIFPDQPFAPGSISDVTLSLEKIDLTTGRRASWIDDSPFNDRIDHGEVVHWSWSTGSHSNSLIPVFARGVGATRLAQLALHSDPVRGPYLDNTDIFRIANLALDSTVIFADDLESGDTRMWSYLVAR